MQLDKLTKEEINSIYEIILDSKKQNELMNNPNSQEAWKLDFVFDNRLLMKLEKYSQKLLLEDELKNNIVKNQQSNIKI